MNRTARVVVPGFTHHITQRGNDQQAVFDEHDDNFVEKIEGILSRELKKEGREGRKRI
jgi:REP element-mobilizing transposase RayT